MDPILIHEDRGQRRAETTDARTSHVYRQMRNDMLDGLMGDRTSEHAYVTHGGKLATRTALDWFLNCVDDELANDVLSILGRLANRQSDPRDLVEMQLQAMALLSRCAKDYAEMYADQIVQMEETQ